ncbi:proline peptidase [Helicobacter didelphidarum]|uniref:Proline peptidase n=1 Tax=Helicobacter didelphidarum TaxID=2040648 RepID=A0A3D8IPJ8_9HELI|nr:M24 family metallopeptidase [Helicobacter didelphidarum]RDU67142.1 proline peptidase [Helicobacter didelphidarum]
MKSHNFITRDESAMYYECGYSADNAILLRFGSELKFITDSRYASEARQLCKKNIAIEIIESGNIQLEAITQIQKHNIKYLQFDPTRMCVDEYFAIKDITILEPNPNFTQEKRMVKTDEEIMILLESQRLNLKAFDSFAKFIAQEGKEKDEKFLWYKISDILSNFGQFPLSFEPIIGIESNAAKPHALPSDRTFLQNGDTLLLDCGLKHKRYCSDCTRTALFTDKDFTFNKNQDFSNLQSHKKDSPLSWQEKQKIYDIVRKAQMNAIQNLRSGMSGKEIDKLARDVIEQSGYGKYFLHSTGHGIGLDIHEMPFISKRSETIIEDGMVFSIEPGIYLENVFGVRIEDLVVVKNGRAEILQ